MKKLLSIATVALTAGVSTMSFAADTQTKNLSYALGYQFGNMMHHFQSSVDVDSYVNGMKTALNGSSSKLTDAQMKQIMTDFQKRMQTKGKQMMDAEATTNAKASEDFLAKNKDAKGVVTLGSGLQYKVLTQGKGDKPTAQDTVTVDYEGTLINGKVFDSSYKRGQPATFPLNGVIPGWTQGLQLMPVGSTYEFYIPANLAYGARGVPGIGPNQALIFKVHLISIKK